MRKVGLETCLINLQRCDDTSVQEIRKLAGEGSILDGRPGAAAVLDRVGSLVAEALADEPPAWGPLERLITALGDCSQDCGADRLMSFCQSGVLVAALMRLVQKWSTFFEAFHDHDLLEFSRAHGCFHGAVYVLVGMAGCDGGAQTMLSGPETLEGVRVVATLLQHEAQYPTQEMMLEFVCRFLLYSSKRNMKAHKTLVDALPLGLRKACNAARPGPVGVLSNMRKYLLEVNKGNPNLVSLPVFSVSVIEGAQRRPVGSVAHIDMGYEVVSFLVEDGPNVSIHYRQLIRVNFSERKNCFELSADDDVSRATTLHSLLGTRSGDTVSLLIEFKRADKKSLAVVKSVIDNRLQSLADAEDARKFSMATSADAPIVEAKETHSRKRPSSTDDVATGGRDLDHQSQGRRKKVRNNSGASYEQSFLALVKENAAPARERRHSPLPTGYLRTPAKRPVTTPKNITREKIPADAGSGFKRKFGTELSLNTNLSSNAVKSRKDEKKPRDESLRIDQPIAKVFSKVADDDGSDEDFSQSSPQRFSGMTIIETLEDRIGVHCKDSSDSPSDADNDASSSAMSLLLKELVALNKARAERQRDRKILHAVSAAIDQVVYYLDNWKNFACDQANHSFGEINQDLAKINAELSLQLDSSAALHEKLDSSYDLLSAHVRKLESDTEELRSGIREFIDAAAREDKNISGIVLSKSRQAVKGGLAHTENPKHQKSTLDAIKLLEKLK